MLQKVSAGSAGRAAPAALSLRPLERKGSNSSSLRVVIHAQKPAPLTALAAVCSHFPNQSTALPHLESPFECFPSSTRFDGSITCALPHNKEIGRMPPAQVLPNWSVRATYFLVQIDAMRSVLLSL